MRQACVIINPAAGAGRTAKRWPAAVAALRAAAIDPQVVLTERPGHAIDLADQAVRRGVDLVIAVGGDGTAHEVANGLLRHSQPPPLGLIQTGTGRDLSRLLALPSSVSAQARLLAEATPLRLDVGWCRYTVDGRAGAPEARERRAFLLLVGVGFSADVVRRSRRWKPYTRSLTYFLVSLLEWWRAAGVPATVTLDGATEPVSLVELAVLNAPWGGGGMRLAPGADPRDGWLEALIVPGMRRWRLLGLLLRLYSGSHISRPGVRYGTTRNVHIESEVALPVAIDGEYVGRTPVEVTVAMGALPVLAKEVRPG